MKTVKYIVRNCRGPEIAPPVLHYYKTRREARELARVCRGFVSVKIRIVKITEEVVR